MTELWKSDNENKSGDNNTSIARSRQDATTVPIEIKITYIQEPAKPVKAKASLRKLLRLKHNQEQI